MRACWYEAAGPAREVLQVGDLAQPTPGPGEVLVRVHVSGVNPTDIKRRAGGRGGLPFPRIVPHFDAGGVIEAVGEGVPEARAGERVWVWEGQLAKPFGTAADHVVVPESRAVPLAEGVGFREAACVGVPAMTAHYALSLGGDLAGRTVLITGGAGAVGNYAIQLAKRMGARVITTVSSERKAEDAARAGADQIIDYRREAVGERVLALSDGAGVAHMVDVDIAAHLADAWRYIADGGRIACYGSQSDPEPPLPFARYMYKNLSIHGVAIFGVPEEAKRAAAIFVSDALGAGALWHRVDSVFPLDEAAAAHERQASGEALGSVLVELG